MTRGACVLPIRAYASSAVGWLHAPKSRWDGLFWLGDITSKSNVRAAFAANVRMRIVRQPACDELQTGAISELP